MSGGQRQIFCLGIRTKPCIRYQSQRHSNKTSRQQNMIAEITKTIELVGEYRMKDH